VHIPPEIQPVKRRKRISSVEIEPKPSAFIYDLYGVCNHFGNVLGGHYTSFVKNTNEKWYHYNDTQVQHIENTNILINPMAYCLFYKLKK
jgi:ubiquitin C-terminal hydrolase